jgi:outer membrane protein OmpA-like peptidoglycan-associated protein
MKKITTLLVCLLLSEVSAQMAPGEYSSTNRKAISYLEAGKKAFEVKKDDVAEKNFKKAIEEDPNFIEANLGLANLYQVTNRHKEAIVYFKKAVSINPRFFPNSLYFLSLSQMADGQYDDAKLNLETFLKYDRISPATKERAEEFLVNATFAAQAVKNPRPFNPINVGAGINTSMNEYFPAVTADGNQFIFTRGVTDARRPGYENEDFYVSEKQKDVWQTATGISEINSIGNEGAPALSADGTIMFFASCANELGDYGAPGRKGYGSCDIFYSQKINGKWTLPRNAGPAVNTNNWETQPSFSSDGKTLYFIRGMINRGSVRDQDIYSSTIGEDGKFATAVKISTNVNSPQKEESVFIHPDNQTLYFSSDGHPGMGGLDVFMSRRQADGDWGKAINLGYPINTFNDENSLLVYPNGKLAFFASNKSGGFGGLDVYQFELPEDLRPQKITYVKGKVYDATTKLPLEANFELINPDNQQVINRSYSQKNGEFFVTLTENNNYIVNVNKDGYLFYSDNFLLKSSSTDFNKPYLLNIPLQPIDIGSTVELKNIFFDVNKAELKPQSKAELEKLISLLSKNPSLKIELGGHTDNSGDKKFNLSLSLNRAKAVYDYLLNNGRIDATRLKYQGYGDSKPKVANDTPENKAKNRRTEFKVIAK